MYSGNVRLTAQVRFVTFVDLIQEVEVKTVLRLDFCYVILNRNSLDIEYVKQRLNTIPKCNYNYTIVLLLSFLNGEWLILTLFSADLVKT